MGLTAVRHYRKEIYELEGTIEMIQNEIEKIFNERVPLNYHWTSNSNVQWPNLCVIGVTEREKGGEKNT